MTSLDDMGAALALLVRRTITGADGIANLRRLSGGASQETWAFDAVGPGGTTRLILRRAPGGDRQHETAVGLEGEAQLIKVAREAGVPEPQVHHVLVPSDGIGRGFIVGFIDGETLGRKIVREERFAEARKTLALRCGEVLALIHRIPLDRLPPLRTASARGRFEELHRRYKIDGRPRPVFALAFEWLRERIPPDLVPPRLVHGDFRNGNLIIGEDGLRAVLDWEIAHLGDPIEDLGWLCTGAWRFGAVDKPVGGFGLREELIAGYRAGGGDSVDLEHLKFWEVLGSLSWGVSCSSMTLTFRSGVDASSERAMIARRASENEIDLLNLLLPRS
ncbi:MAG: phosphotransferase family protein [Rhizomicrobium sp.]